MSLINYQVLSSALDCTKTEGESYCFLRDETLLGISCATHFVFLDAVKKIRRDSHHSEIMMILKVLFSI